MIIIIIIVTILTIIIIVAILLLLIIIIIIIIIIIDTTTIGELAWLAELPYFIRSVDLGSVFVHAGFKVGRPVTPLS